MRRISRLLAIARALLLILAVAWWAIVFLRVIGNGYLSSTESIICSVNGSAICDLAMSLCGSSHPLGIEWYSPATLWLSVAVLSAAALAEAFAAKHA